MDSDHKRRVAAGCTWIAAITAFGGWAVIAVTHGLLSDWMLAPAVWAVISIIIAQHFHQSAELDDLVNEYAR